MAPTNDEIVNALRELLGGGTTSDDEVMRPMLNAIGSSEDVARFGRMFESLWEFWCTPCNETKYLVKMAYQFICNIANDDMCRDDFALIIPPAVLSEFKRTMQIMARDNWGFDLTKNISPHASTGPAPPISMPD